MCELRSAIAIELSGRLTDTDVAVAVTDEDVEDAGDGDNGLSELMKMGQFSLLEATFALLTAHAQPDSQLAEGDLDVDEDAATHRPPVLYGTETNAGIQ